MSRRPSISIYDYPEDLNPFNDSDSTTIATTKTATKTNGSNRSINAENDTNFTKEHKHKFWTFGRSKKKQRSNSFSIKSTWNGLFGKRRESPEVEIRKSAIATVVPSTYKRGTYNGYPTASARLSRDQQEFNEALGTLARRRKYTLDNASRHGSTLTVNGDSGRIYEGHSQDTTTSILDNLTPKAPARRFGQVSPKPTEKIPPLDYHGTEENARSNGSVDHDVAAPDCTPIPPKRGGPRASQRSLAPFPTSDDVSPSSADFSLTDENENVPEDYVFKRCNRDAIRRSNLSINSCVSVGSTVSAYGRKKRRAPQPPPLIKEPLETAKEIEASTPSSLRVNEDAQAKEREIDESIDIARVTENIYEMTKRSRELDEENLPSMPCAAISSSNNEDITGNNVTVIVTQASEEACMSSPKENPMECEAVTEAHDILVLRTSSEDRGVVADEEKKEASYGATARLEDRQISSSVETPSDRKPEETSLLIVDQKETDLAGKDDEAKLDESHPEDCSPEDSPLRRRESCGNLSRSGSFSVKDEIEKIERQIKILEATKPHEVVDRDDEAEAAPGDLERAHTRMASLREQRKNFFRGMHEVDDAGVKVELRELPREQNDIRLVRIEDPPVPNVGPTEPVRVIELHISEPIRRKPEGAAIAPETRDVNPIPKPRRHSNLDLYGGKETRVKVRHEKEQKNEKRGNSL